MWPRALAVALLIVVTACALLVTLLARSNPQTPQQEPQLYAGVPSDAHLLALDKRALDEAYHEHLRKLFSVWLTSGAPADAKQITNGLRIARRAYAQAAGQIAKREQEIAPK